MARIVVCPYGSSGDINPFIALGLELQTRGHAVVFAVEPTIVHQIAAMGFAVEPLPNQARHSLARFREQLFGGTDPLIAAKILFEFQLLPMLPAMTTRLINVCRGADLVVHGLLQFAAPLAAEHLGIPWVTLIVSPLHLPLGFRSSSNPTSVPDQLAATGMTLDQWWSTRQVFRTVGDGMIGALRDQLELPSGHDFLMDGIPTPRLVTVAVARSFLPPTLDWPDNVQVTGVCAWDCPPTWSMPAELSTFLAGSGPVIACSAGSMTGRLHNTFTTFYTNTIAATQALGVRLLLIGAAARSLPQPLPPHVLALSFVPFSQVYPYCAAVIHHGGIGSVLKALQAGTPMLIVPWGIDQFANGIQVDNLGVGHRMLRADYEVARVVPVLQDLLCAQKYRRRAQYLGQQIDAEHGAQTLADHLEQQL